MCRFKDTITANTLFNDIGGEVLHRNFLTNRGISNMGSLLKQVTGRRTDYNSAFGDREIRRLLDEKKAADANEDIEIADYLQMQLNRRYTNLRAMGSVARRISEVELHRKAGIRNSVAFRAKQKEERELQRRRNAIRNAYIETVPPPPPRGNGSAWPSLNAPMSHKLAILSETATGRWSRKSRQSRKSRKSRQSRKSRKSRQSRKSRG